MKSRNILITAIFLSFAVICGCQREDKQVKTEDVSSPKTYEPVTQNNQSSGISDLEEKTKDNIPGDKMKFDRTVTNVNNPQPTENYNTQDKRMIIRSGSMSIEVDVYDNTEVKIKQIVTGLNGYITNTNATLNPSGKKQGTITIRVASDKFDQLIAEISKTGKVMNENITGHDITEEYMDADARLKTQQQLEDRLLKLLAEKTSSLPNIVEVEDKLASVRQVIETTQGRMKYLKDQAAYSTIAVSVYEPSMLVTSSGGGFFYELGESVKKGLQGFTVVVSGMLTFVIALSPFAAILILLYFIITRIVRKKKLAKA